MEPRQSLSEQVPTPAPRLEQPIAGEFSLPGVEKFGVGAHEQGRPLPEAAEAIRQMPSGAPSVLPTPVPVTPQISTATTTSDTPIVAADEDLIEKEWVDKAKQIISSTKDDPYRREQEIKRLQLDYVRKRYGKEIGATEG